MVVRDCCLRRRRGRCAASSSAAPAATTSESACWPSPSPPPTETRHTPPFPAGRAPTAPRRLKPAKPLRPPPAGPRPTPPTEPRQTPTCPAGRSLLRLRTGQFVFVSWKRRGRAGRQTAADTPSQQAQLERCRRPGPSHCQPEWPLRPAPSSTHLPPRPFSVRCDARPPRGVPALPGRRASLSSRAVLRVPVRPPPPSSLSHACRISVYMTGPGPAP